ncbi:hypothetical protein GOB57_25120 [Sinorhizobium meliloti]|nr:hypothetical protein [Sinorhizobium meliloti]
MRKPVSTFAPSIRFEIFIAGDYAQAKQICRKWTLEVGACVTVEPVDYIYTGGEEQGIRVGLINYPRFPTDHDALYAKTRALAEELMIGLCQLSYSIVGPETTEWVSRRPE